MRGSMLFSALIALASAEPSLYFKEQFEDGGEFHSFSVGCRYCQLSGNVELA